MGQMTWFLRERNGGEEKVGGAYRLRVTAAKGHEWALSVRKHLGVGPSATRQVTPAGPIRRLAEPSRPRIAPPGLLPNMPGVRETESTRRTNPSFRDRADFFPGALRGEDQGAGPDGGPGADDAAQRGTRDPGPGEGRSGKPARRERSPQAG